MDVVGFPTLACLMYIMFDVMLHYISGCLWLPWQSSAMFTLILCKVYVEVVTKSVLLFQKVSVFGTQTKPLTTKIHEMCNKVW